MFSKILVGVDGGPGGTAALALAQALAMPGSELVLVHVWPPVEGIGAAALGQPPPHLVAETLLTGIARRSARGSRVLAVEADTVAAGLHHAAREEQAALLVIGSSSRGATGRVLLGDDLRAELHGASYAVAIAPRGPAVRPTPLQHIGVGCQDADEGRAAYAVACEIAAEHDAELEALRVLAPVPGVAGAYVALSRELTDDRERAAERELATLSCARRSVLHGPVTDALARASERLDLLVLGSRGTGRVGQLLFGSTVDGVVRAAACPVLVVPRGGAASGTSVSSAAAVVF
jgi:nucleotide-binding universal stress UspA family protein